MQRFFPNIRTSSPKILCVILAAVAMLAGCGKGGSSASNAATVVTTINVAPATLSMDTGQVASISAQAVNSTGAPVLSAVITYKSDNTAVANVSTTGSVCAGTWDTTFIVCTPAAVIGTANIVASTGSISSTPVPVATHRKISNVTITTVTPTGGPCTSQGATSPNNKQQFTGHAFASDGTDITSTVGPFSWAAADLTVTTIDTTGLATAVNPGVSLVAALNNGVNSLPSQLIVCPPASILLSELNSNPAVTDFTLNLADTKTLGVTITDTLGQPITTSGALFLGLQFASTRALVANVTATGVISALSPGKATIVASCTPPKCNPGANNPTYSNIVTVNVNGTNSSTVYAAAKNGTSIVPIDPTTNAAGTPITIPTVTVNSVAVQPVVNSFLFSSNGSGYIGTDQGLLVLSPTINTVANTAPFAGKVLATAPNGNTVLVYDPVIKRVLLIDIASNSGTPFAIQDAVAARYSPDSMKVFVVTLNQAQTQSSLYVISPVAPLRQYPLAAPATDLSFLPQGNFAYLAGGTASSISMRNTCNDAALTTVATAQSPTFIEGTWDSTHIFAVDNANAYDIAVTAVTQPCPPAIPTQSLTTTSYGQGAFTPNQLIVLPDGSRTYLTSSLNKVLIYQPGVGVSSVNLLGGATAATTGGATQDSKLVYVGAVGSNDVQKIDVATGVVTAIPVTIKDSASVVVAPDFVAVVPR